MRTHLKIQQALAGLAAPRIVIVRSLPGLGDWLCCVPALRALRVAFPDAHISLVGLPSAQQFGQRFPVYIDTWLEFPGFPGVPEVPLEPKKVSAFWAMAQALGFDLALQMHGNGSCMNLFSLLLDAQLNAGFFPTDGFCPDTNFFLPYPDAEPEVWRHLRLMEFLGIPPQGTHLEFPIAEQEWQEWQAIAINHRLSNHYVCIHPGASVAERRSSPQHFAQIGDGLAARGWQVVLTGTAAEADLTQAVAAEMRFPAINLAGNTSLGALAALLKQGHLLVCNDTGVSHLAAALQVNSVVIFSNSDVQRWAPLNRHRHRVVHANSTRLNSEQLSIRVIAEALKLLEMEFANVS